MLGAPPCGQCVRMVAQIQQWLLGRDVESVHVTTDIRQYGNQGVVTVIWGSGPSAREVAEVFAVGHRDGLPLLPAWVGLKAEHDFDLRWQTPY